MTKLEEIERKISTYQNRDHKNEDWLIARVKRLESALKIYASHDATNGQFGAPAEIAKKALEE